MLYEEFYDDPKHKYIRRVLDYDLEEDLKKLQDAIKNNSNPELEEKLVDYLYFFEFISSLWQMKQISIGEIDMLFEYYVELLLEHEFIPPYLEKEGYKNTVKLLEFYKKTG